MRKKASLPCPIAHLLRDRGAFGKSSKTIFMTFLRHADNPIKEERVRQNERSERSEKERKVRKVTDVRELRGMRKWISERSE